jgi:hypothetical protein
MVASAVLALLFAASAGVADSTGAGPRADAARVGADAAVPGLSRVGVDAEPDTVRRRRKAFQLSEEYNSRRKLHKASSYAMLPMFAFEYAAGNQLMQKSSAAPSWARTGHRVVATGLVGLFGLNTYTGGLNWWETRGQEDGRAWRTVHSALMLLSDAGFAWAGQLSKPAENSISTRRLHKQVAVTSISIASVSYLMMLKPFRRD